MIVFYTNSTEDVLLAAVVKHNNPGAILREYTGNQDLLSIAKMHNEFYFIRVKDYKQAILKKYKSPNWMKNKNNTCFIQQVLAHNESNSHEIIQYLALNLFNPEKLFYSSSERTIMFQRRAKEVNRELNAFKRGSKKEYRNDILFMNINPKHNITKLLVEDLTDSHIEPFVVLRGEKAVVGNADLLGFENNIVKMKRYEAYKLRKKTIIIAPTIKKIRSSVITRLCEF